MSKIIVYGAKWCGDCTQSIRFLEENNIKYEYIDIEKNPKKADEVVKLNEKIGKGSFRSIPLIMIGNLILSEPTNEELAKALQLN